MKRLGTCAGTIIVVLRCSTTAASPRLNTIQYGERPEADGAAGAVGDAARGQRPFTRGRETSVLQQYGSYVMLPVQPLQPQQPAARVRRRTRASSPRSTQGMASCTSPRPEAQGRRRETSPRPRPVLSGSRSGVKHDVRYESYPPARDHTRDFGERAVI